MQRGCVQTVQGLNEVRVNVSCVKSLSETLPSCFWKRDSDRGERRSDTSAGVGGSGRVNRCLQAQSQLLNRLKGIENTALKMSMEIFYLLPYC